MAKHFQTRRICSNSEDKRQMRIKNALKLVKGVEAIGKMMRDDVTKRLFAKWLKGGCVRLPLEETTALFDIWCAGFGTAIHLVEEGAISSVMLEVDLDPKGESNEE